MSKSAQNLSIDAGLLRHQAGDLAGAADIYRQILARDENQPDALNLLGVIAHSWGHLDDAVELISGSLRIDPHNVGAINNLAGVVKDQGRFDEAVDLYDAAIFAAPDQASFHSNRGNALKELRRFDEAIQSYKAALEIDPKNVAAMINLGALCKELGRLQEAESFYQSALRLAPESLDALCNMGSLLQERARYGEAEALFARALAVFPDSALALTNFGASLNAQGRSGEAIVTLQKALEIDPRSDLAHNNLGNALKESNRFAEAIACFRAAIALNPGFYLAHSNLGSALVEIGETTEALNHFRRALELRPEYDRAFSNLLFALNYLPRTDPKGLFEEHRRFDRQYGVPLQAKIPVHSNNVDTERKLHVGYVSGDFREHSVAYFIEPVFAQHDARQFEIFCYSNHPVPDATTERLRSQVEHWRCVAGMTDDELADAIRQDQIDILVDLSGHTARNRLLVFARKPAPIQMSMIGYMQTTGLSAMDYRITDERLDPVGTSEHLSSEELVRLEAGAAPYRPPADCPETGDLPALRTGYITFGSFNNLAKVTPAVLDAWAEILRLLPTARLLAIGREGNDLQSSLAQRGVSAERVEVVPRQPIRKYLALHHRVDILLDTFPYNGGTTSLLALWMGVPFVTLAGTSSTDRVGEGLLLGVSLSEMIATTPDDYVNRALAAARDESKLVLWRSELRGRMERLLGEGRDFTLQFEEACRGMWRRWCHQKSLATAVPTTNGSPSPRA